MAAALASVVTPRLIFQKKNLTNIEPHTASSPETELHAGDNCFVDLIIWLMSYNRLCP